MDKNQETTNHINPIDTSEHYNVFSAVSGGDTNLAQYIKRSSLVEALYASYTFLRHVKETGAYELKTEVDELRRKIDHLSEYKQDLIDENSQQIHEIEKLESKIDSLKEENHKLKNNITEEMFKREELDKRNDHNCEQFSRISRERDDLEEENIDLKAEIHDLKAFKDSFKAMNESLVHSDQEIHDLKAKIRGIEAEIKDKNDIIADLELHEDRCHKTKNETDRNVDGLKIENNNLSAELSKKTLEFANVSDRMNTEIRELQIVVSEQAKVIFARRKSNDV